MSQRTVFGPEHDEFRETVRSFFERDLMPLVKDFERDGHVSREFYRKAGSLGMVSPFISANYGGPGGDFLHFLVVVEEMGTSPGGSVIGPSLEYGLVAFHIANFGSEEQKRRWLPSICSGETLISLGMTEPGSGSDLQGMKTLAIRDGDSFIVNGAKTYISNAVGADLMVLAAKTDPTAGARGITLFMVDTRSEGFIRGRVLQKMGMQAADTLEIFFQDMRVPATAILGGEGNGFSVMMSELPKERLVIAARSVAEAQTALDLTLDFVKSRRAFGQTVYDFQNTQFKLAEMDTEINIGRAFVDQCIAEYKARGLDNRRTAMAKLWCSEMAGRVIDSCVQLHGGAGYMSDYWISKIYTATRIRRIFGGTSEIMKRLIAKGM